MKNDRFILLDGIRGVAAIFVFIRHTTNYWNFTVFHSYLAVDLFFVLSGFVIANAYEEKLKNNTLTIYKFFIVRLIRLYPVFILSLFIGAFVLIGKTFLNEQINSIKCIELFSLILITALFLPFKIDGSESMFPLNGPYWSLFFELLLNLIFALIRPCLNNLNLFLIVGSSGIVLSALSIYNGGIDAGFYWSWLHILIGFLRAAFGIFMGVLLFRHHIYFHSKFFKMASPCSALFIISVILFLPSFGNVDMVIDVFSVIIIFPACVLIASQGIDTKFEKILVNLGAASYPLYVLHKPIAQILSFGLKDIAKKYAPLSGILFLIILIYISVFLEKKYDIPIRRWVSDRLLKKRSNKISQ
jgi:peptidoglycan/LPS O-acetylase OafA/YrhL